LSILVVGLVALVTPLRAQFVYVANQGSGNVSAYSIGPNGALTLVPGSPFAAGINPNSIAITPLVPFATSFAKLHINPGGFDLNESFTLGTTGFLEGSG
jgi:hypothetical protein